ncbi:ribosomal RNA adenine dimethylase-domain-containing protein [Tricharina praecox]|uniref:ribosomal RNA adenine dimethylase-domain-containing protein n=1 Tax=Tricharina praecox TaxID=43433 RepID=UPI0022211786|nr:ribosomal RNA adenine dimethylase-domain-containing protein [Tricharina praecox]KAI5855497.1 ribosomal RNA adenine dimethylase-domain-containing protein [Tricharina praecox]
MAAVNKLVKEAIKLSRQLSPRTVGSRNAHFDIVNQDFAQSTLDALKLEDTHKNAHVIDMNPGLGLWSQAIYDRLQPKSYTLLEPNDSYREHLKTLKPEYPRMSVVGLDGYEWDTYTKLFEATQFPEPAFEPGFQPPQYKTVPPEEGLNTDLLFVGNLTRISSSQRLISQLIETCLLGGWVQRFGRVRFVLWMTSIDKERLLPHALQGRARASVVTDAAAEVTEVVGGAHRTGRGFSTPQWEGDVPKKRTHKRVLKSNTLKLKAEVDKVELSYTKWQEQCKLNPLARTLCRGPAIVERYRRAIRVFLAHVKQEIYIDGPEGTYAQYDLPKLLEMYNEVDIEAMKDKRAEGLTEEEHESYTEFEEQYLLSMTLDRAKENSLIDEKYAHSLQPPLLQAWHPRNISPIVPSEKDVYPPKKLNLLDFQPKLAHEYFRHPDPTVRDQRVRIFTWIVRTCFGLRAQSLKTVLKNLAPGGEYILEELPGEMSKTLGKKRVRCLTVDELVEITAACERWPFKPVDLGFGGYNRSITAEKHMKFKLE